MNAAPAGRNAPPKGLVIAAFATVYLLWGSTYFGIRYAVETIPPFLMGGSRFFVAGLLLIAWAARKGLAWPGRRQWRDAAIVGCLMLVGGNGGVTWAEKDVPSSVAALIVAIVPLWMVLLEWCEPGAKRPSARVFAGLIAGFVGVGFLVFNGHGYDGAALNPWSVAAILVATVTWAGGSLFSRRAAKPGSALVATGMQMVTGGAVMVGIGLAMGEGGEFHVAEISAVSAWAWLYLAIFGSLIGFTCYLWLLQVSTPSKVSTTSFVNPLVAVVLGCAFGGEPFTSRLIVSAALILLAVVLILRRGRSRETTPERAQWIDGKPQPRGAR